MVFFTNLGSKVGAWDQTPDRSILRSNSQPSIVPLGCGNPFTFKYSISGHLLEHEKTLKICPLWKASFAVY